MPRSSEEASREDIELTRDRQPYVKPEELQSLRRILVQPRDEIVRLACYPGDDVSQARALYGDRGLCRRLIKLGREDEWTLVPNMHFGHLQPGYAWTPVREGTTVQDYFDYWVNRKDQIGRVGRRDWDRTLSALIVDGMLESRETFDRDFSKDWNSPSSVQASS